MDPNKCLEDIRELVKTVMTRGADEVPLSAGDLAEMVDALDQWLTKGGFLPDAWKRPKITRRP